MKAPDSFDGTQAYKFRGFIQSCQLLFHNDPAKLFYDRDKLFTLFGDSNEVSKAEKELYNLRMKESGQVSLYIAYFRILMSRIGDWGERSYIHVYRRGLASRLLNQLAYHSCNFDTLQELMEITFELDKRYHERQKEKGSHQDKKPPLIQSNASRLPQDSSSKRPHHKKSKKGKNFQVSKDRPHASLLNKDNKLIGAKRRGGLKKVYALIVIENTQLKNASRGLRIGQEYQEGFLWVVDLPSFPSFKWDPSIIGSPKGKDLILGYDLLYHFNTMIDWKLGLITYNSSGINSSTSNELATSVNSVALVDEVFKEIKDVGEDVGEDVSISSLHLFQGDMDLPPLSLHASLEEQWDEEGGPEEIETFLKVVSPAYHQ
ncbi:hypothetical protein O181_073898 [Austropuccinia psidii MF-1]|uniref:Retrotransposon gag domain-containing protein n=1 Tax=Austropuccinia psidii MF-1 TaxID=1389203 RepID=A0A9Q3F5Y7_9BASI|nr:hypothetical protein [Austropuccinia psidii MF-1]